jgi:hypothetical protein
MVRQHSKEDLKEAWRGSAEERARKKPGEGDHPHRAYERPGVTDDADLHWQRRELKEGWRDPQYEGFYDESLASERTALSESASAARHAHMPQVREEGECAQEEFWATPGPESGKGPKGYSRSDARLFEEVCERLTKHGQLDATGIKVSCEEGEVVLRGSVKDEEAKRIAEACALSVSGVRKVRNKLKLRSDRS